MDLGLVIGRYGDALQVGDGVCAAGDGAAHHEVIARLIVFRPFVEEVCIGTIIASSEEGIQVTIGFFDDIFIPAYWMLRPSLYDADLARWVWTPNYDGEDDNDEARGIDSGIKMEEDHVKQEEVDEGDEEENRFEMEIGAEIRFKVKSINFTQVTNTAKGVQATTTTTAHSVVAPRSERALSVGSAGSAGGMPDGLPLRRRSSSVDLNESEKVPESMHIVASICEDGLGLTSWWAAADQEDESEADDVITEE
eukprot:CAMPEP_0194220244 /NCGR_PEP_ID=MMETSP0156-20130528/27841_1 /TAXON_ID=33649 /ORGANISM="Thalassionema nitzschioides, Strain L26-B" /LENGTH=251 /DNA_ID=CAMNT_0038950197 /DNA_START=232 /DNA_END=987 /DNA_ORIENTATION=+